MLGVDVPLYPALEPAVREAEAIVLVTRWGAFEQVPTLLRDVDPPPLIVDGRRMLDRTRVARYEGVGM